MNAPDDLPQLARELRAVAAIELAAGNVELASRCHAHALMLQAMLPGVAVTTEAQVSGEPKRGQ